MLDLSKHLVCHLMPLSTKYITSELVPYRNKIIGMKQQLFNGSRNYYYAIKDSIIFEQSYKGPSSDELKLSVFQCPLPILPLLN